MPPSSSLLYAHSTHCRITKSSPMNFQVTNSVGLGFYISMVLYGLGRHKYYLSDYDYKMLLKWDYLDWPQTFLTLAISKISICLLLLRLSQLSKLKKVLHWLVLFIVATHLLLMVLMIVQCRPVEKAWNTAIDGTCFSKNIIGSILIAQGWRSFASILRTCSKCVLTTSGSLLHPDRFHRRRLSRPAALERQDQARD